MEIYGIVGKLVQILEFLHRSAQKIKIKVFVITTYTIMIHFCILPRYLLKTKVIYQGQVHTLSVLNRQNEKYHTALFSKRCSMEPFMRIE